MVKRVVKKKKTELDKVLAEESKKVNEPLWKGPFEDGVTQSLLGKFLVCRERFRIHTVEGLRPTPKFEKNLEFGNMWHLCEECHAEGVPWEEPLKKYAQGLVDNYREERGEVEKWFQVCKVQFPVYEKYWGKQKDVRLRTPVLQEEVFRVPVTLGSGRKVTMTGKWDAVDLIGPKKNSLLFLQENKTKGEIDEEKVREQLSYDLQSFFYLIALREAVRAGTIEGVPKTKKIAGVRYNVIRRPLSGGRHSVRQHKPTKSKPNGESKSEYYTRLGNLIAEEPEYFFMRWKAEVSESELNTFWKCTLEPLFENLCDWWEYILIDPFNPWGNQSIHWRHPYGVYNPMNQGRGTALDTYLLTGNTVGLKRATTLYPEL